MKLLLSGSHGLLGSALFPALTQQGHTVTRLVRSGSSEPGISWEPSQGRLDAAQLEPFDAVIHLAGESIASGRWTKEKKRRIRDSRVRGTQTLTDAIVQLKQPPQLFLCASAVGYYGDRGAELLTEQSAAGDGFLADVCTAWEVATAPAATKGVRVVNLRFGVILSANGGALQKMLPPFKLGAGGRIGSGEQYLSWVDLDDAVGAILHALKVLQVKGPVNIVAPEPVTNQKFTDTLGQVLSRPTLFPMPAFAAKLAFGEMADALLLASQRVQPSVLIQSAYTFLYPNLENSLRHLLKK